jgi:hypothetical protein
MLAIHQHWIWLLKDIYLHFDIYIKNSGGVCVIDFIMTGDLKLNFDTNTLTKWSI